MSNEQILFERKGPLGLVILNRPEALNSLNETMCRLHTHQLLEWERDNTVAAVVITGAGDKAFCAGGDVVELYRSGLAWKKGDQTSLAWRRFFQEEYLMNIAIKEFKKPYLAFWDGVVMGGGVGISIHGTYRIATEKTLFAMPETGIGMIPDVGGGWFLPRLPHEAGMYLALTGSRLGASDLCALGVAQGFIPSARVPDVIEMLSRRPQDISQTLKAVCQDPGPGTLVPHLSEIAKIFSEPSVESTLSLLEKRSSAWALACRQQILKKSPTSLKITFSQLRQGALLRDFRENMKMEYRIVNRILAGHDFYEGVRALLIDKDKSPQWLPHNLSSVSAADVDKYFLNLNHDELAIN